MKTTWEKSINVLKKEKRLLVNFITNQSVISYPLKWVRAMQWESHWTGVKRNGFHPGYVTN